MRNALYIVGILAFAVLWYLKTMTPAAVECHERGGNYYPLDGGCYKTIMQQV